MGEVADEKNKNFGEFPQSKCVHGNINSGHKVTAEIWESELVERSSKTEICDRVGAEALEAEIQIARLS